MLPAVKDVKLTRKFPSTVVIQLTERKAVAFLPVDKAFIEIDAEGIYIRRGKMQEKSIPVITGCTVNDASIGHEIKDTNVQTALQVIAELPKEMINILSEIHIDNQKRVVVYTIHGVQGRFGYPEEISQKGRIFLQVLNQLDDGQKIEYVDLTSFKLPVVKYV
jgi:cell division protein FtsQ